VFLEGVLVTEFLLEASPNFSETSFNLFHLVLGYSLLIEDGIVVSLENVFRRLVVFNRKSSTGNSVVMGRWGSVHFTLICLRVVVKAVKICCKVLIANSACIFVLEL
jgi:hypothetical protein